MWVSAERFEGTLGGGELERRILERARVLLKGSSEDAILEEFSLCKDMDQCCGGRVEVFFEPVSRRKTIHLFGGGHIGRAVASVLEGMAFEVCLIDPRPEWAAKEGLPASVKAICTDPVEHARSLRWSEMDAACIFTHSHDLDFALIQHLIRQPIGYLGLIGSAHKATVFRTRLSGLKDGSELEGLWDEKVDCPIGRPTPDKTPKVIAVSIVSELLENWAHKSPSLPTKT